MNRNRILHIAGSSLIAMALVCVLLLFFSAPKTRLAASQGSIVVNTLNDELNNDGDCSLREAIQAAQDNTPVDACPAGSAIADTITFKGKGSIQLASPLSISAGGPLVIDGGGTIILDGNKQVRIFLVYAGGDLTLRNLSLVDGYTSSNGGGIYNNGSLFIEASNLSGNYVPGYGGAIYNLGTMQISGSTFSNSYSESGGGGIFNSIGAVLIISNTQFMMNSSYGFGGGVYNAGQADIRSSSFTGAHAMGGAGIYTGDYYITSTALSLADSTIYNNYADDHPGADFAGIGAGILYEGAITISNSTISSNHAARNGGGIHGWSDSAMLIHSTLSGNSASVYWSGGSNIYLYHGAITLKNSIIAGGVGADNCITLFGIITDDGNNIEDANTCGLSLVNGSMPDTDPTLGPLQDNGGATWTQALLPGSPAIDRAKPDYCLPTDQRGVARPVDGDGDGEALCDIGSFEYRQPTTTTITSDQPDPSTAGVEFMTTFSVTTTNGFPTGTVLVDSGKGNCSGELMEGLGSCQLTITAAGTYTLTATYSGDATYEISHATELHVVLPAKIYLPLTTRP